jgi:hypothetical protein
VGGVSVGDEMSSPQNAQTTLGSYGGEADPTLRMPRRSAAPAMDPAWANSTTARKSSSKGTS